MSSSVWDIADFEFWNELSTQERFRSHFQRVLKERLIVCVPPDSAVQSAGGMSDLLITWHLIEPDKRYASKGCCIAHKRAAVEFTPDLVRTTGDAFKEPTVVHVINEDTIRAGDRGDSIRILVVDRSLLSGSDTFVPSTKSFGALGNGVHDAMDYLFAIDETGELTGRLMQELRSFRDSYESLPGYEEHLFSRVKEICSRHTQTWIQTLGKRTMSRRRFTLSVTLAIESFVHAQLYQLVFPEICNLTLQKDAQILRVISGPAVGSGSASSAFDRNATLYGNGTANGAGGVRSASSPPPAVTVGTNTHLTLANLGAGPRLQQVDLSSVATVIDLLNVSTTPFDKLQCLHKVSNAITASVPADLISEVSADAMFPMLSYSLAKWPPRAMYAHLQYLILFANPLMLDGSEHEYNLVTFQAAVEYLLAGAHGGTPRGSAVGGLRGSLSP